MRGYGAGIRWLDMPGVVVRPQALSIKQVSKQFFPRDAEVSRHIGENARESPDLQCIVRRDRHMVL
jgi:hypothetical protein